MIKKSLKLGLLSLVLSICVVTANAYTTYGPVKRGETLWNIAKKTRPTHRVNLDKMMEAIQKLNPMVVDPSTDAVKVGSKLTVPSSVNELREVLNGTAKILTTNSSASTSAASIVDSTADASATASNPSDNSQIANAPVTTKSAKTVGMQGSVTQLQQQLVSAQQGQSAAQAQAQQAQQQLQQAQQKITELQTANDQLQQQNAGFPWAWLWFVLLAILGALWYSKGRHKHHQHHCHDSHEHKDNDLLAEVESQSDEDYLEESDGSAMADAMIAIAEGDYKAAKRLLLNAIRKEHDNIQLRMKLLEVYVLLNDRDAFNAESDYMHKHLIRETDDEWKAIRAMYLKKWVYDN